ncbi:hypothetical protein HU200_049100 [Digitaria exilis]|uniref:Uncharacterized protein n=1 Tax=Digitaria exilis TaxID=1010633 RepID=A0A835AUC5_9POAL|nr:hypothetical protein HU200_049100 [Digitaria exilis]
MEFATGALGTLLPKLGQLLLDEYNLQKGTKKNIEFLKRELETTQAALCSVGKVPPEQIKEHVKIWARDVRELSYDMEDIIDNFLVRVQGPKPPSKKSAKRFVKEMMGIITKAGTRHEIAQEIKDIKERVKEVAERRDRYFIVIDDVWEAHTWETIKLALVENNIGSRIIITTRNHEVAREAGEVYELQPLSEDNSRKLFFARIFGAENKPSEHQPNDISDKILRKCGGIPLAIITMASMLVGKPMEEWLEMHCSIGYSGKANRQVENTMKIISFSYYDLPPQLRTCLLYLSVFPEDSFIEKAPLIWMWIAEGFVQEKQGVTAFEIGRDTSMSYLVRLLSIYVSRPAMMKNRWYLDPVVLVHLRYLRLSRGVVLPEEIGTLKFLQTLDVYEPLTSVGSLTQLLCLRIRGLNRSVPDGIGKLTSLQELQIEYRTEEEERLRQFVKELGALRKLRVLHLGMCRDSPYGSGILMDLVESLRNLQRMDHLSLLSLGWGSVSVDIATFEAWGFLLPRNMQQLILDWMRFSRVPTFCINPSCLRNLSHISLFLDYLDAQDMRVLGGLPELLDLELRAILATEVVSCNTTSSTDAAGEDCFFPKLRSCGLQYEKLQFQQMGNSSEVSCCMHRVQASMFLGSDRKDVWSGKAGISPTLITSIQWLYFSVAVLELIKDGDDCVRLALQYLASLQNVSVGIVCEDDTTAAHKEEVAAVLRRAAELTSIPTVPRLRQI